MSFDVSGKTVLITGAGRGIGRGIARVFARNGARVAINALTETYVGPLVEEIGQSGAEALACAGDLTDSSQVDRVVHSVNEQFGFIDVLINNLGDAIRGPVVGVADEEALSDESWASIVDINLTHAFYCSRTVGRQMLDEGRGKVINVSSSSAHSGGEGLAAYTAAKTGLVGLTRALALEWAPRVQVNAIAPGSFPDAETMTEKELQESQLRAKDRIPLGRAGQVEEVGYLAVYLASSASDYMTGQTIYLDGGLTLT